MLVLRKGKRKEQMQADYCSLKKEVTQHPQKTQQTNPSRSDVKKNLQLDNMHESWWGRCTSISLHSNARCCQSLCHVLRYVRNYDLFSSSEEQQFQWREIVFHFDNCQVVAFLLLSRTEPSRSAMCASLSFLRAKSAEACR